MSWIKQRSLLFMLCVAALLQPPADAEAVAQCYYGWGEGSAHVSSSVTYDGRVWTYRYTLSNTSQWGGGYCNHSGMVCVYDCVKNNDEADKVNVWSVPVSEAAMKNLWANWAKLVTTPGWDFHFSMGPDFSIGWRREYPHPGIGPGTFVEFELVSDYAPVTASIVTNLGDSNVVDIPGNSRTPTRVFPWGMFMQIISSQKP